jgi:hypothetical protein
MPDGREDFHTPPRTYCKSGTIAIHRKIVGLRDRYLPAVALHKRDCDQSPDPSAEVGSAMPSMLRRLFGWLFRADPDQPAPPVPSDPERDKYRASDPSTRDATTCHADPLGRIIDAWSDTIPRPVEQLAEDLSGHYGPYAVKWKGTFRTKWEFGLTAESTSYSTAKYSMMTTTGSESAPGSSIVMTSDAWSSTTTAWN